MPDLILQGLGALLKRRDFAKAGRLVCVRITLRWDHMRVVVTNSLEVNGMSFLVEVAHRVGAKQRERVRLRQLVPELLEANRPIRVPVLPQNVNHFAVSANTTVAAHAQALLYHAPDSAVETSDVGHRTVHEMCEHLMGVEHCQVAAPCGVFGIQTSGFQPKHERFAMRLRRDDHQRLADGYSVSQEVSHGGREEMLVLVELNGVSPAGRLG
jgi:hypothetical protein